MIGRFWIVLFLAALVLAAALGSSAHADGSMIGPGGGEVFRDSLGSAEPHVIIVPPNLSTEAQERTEKWEQRCVLGFHTDRLGVEHYVYRRVGCEFGRTNGPQYRD